MANTTAPQGDFIDKSVDNGRTWVKTTTQPSETGDGLGGTTMEGLFSNTNFTTPSAPATQMSIITDIQCPGADGNTVYCTDGYDIFKSTNGGLTWAADVNLFNANVGASTSTYIVSISIGYIGTNAYAFACIRIRQWQRWRLRPSGIGLQQPLGEPEYRLQPADRHFVTKPGLWQ